MSYQVIARKWRPQSFEELVGQAHVSQTLSNALKNNRLPHAILFTGPRGTGKTSSARILAKSLRCQNAINFVPCNQCSSCEEITSGRSVDVMEIDGASNNGVDAIRELRDSVAFAPSSGKYKIYIIDEVHMLSTSAFNALLKTLEEPPAHVVFMMATTEPHKIPQTILSRCQRFDLKRIPSRQISERLELICKTEKIQANEEALWIIARQGDGSMRDAFSLLDQVITFANGPLTKEGVVEILGLTDRSLLLETLTALASRDTKAMMKVIEKIAISGFEASLFAADLLEQIRNALLLKVSGDSETTLVEIPDSEIRFLKDLTKAITEEDLHLLFDMAIKGASDLQRSSEPQIVLEMVLLRMAAAPRVQEILSISTAPTVRPAATTGERPIIPPGPIRVAGSVSPVRSSIGLNPGEKWLRLIEDIKHKDAMFGAKIEPLLFIGIKDKKVELSISSKHQFLKETMADTSNQKKLLQFIDADWGPGHSLDLKSGKDNTTGVSAQKMASDQNKKNQEDVLKQVNEHPLVKSATSVFKGQVRIKQ